MSDSINNIKHSLSDMLYDVKDKLSDNEYKLIVEKVAELKVAEEPPPPPRRRVVRRRDPAPIIPDRDDITYNVIKVWKRGTQDVSDEQVYMSTCSYNDAQIVIARLHEQWLTQPSEINEGKREAILLQVFNRNSEDSSDDED